TTEDGPILIGDQITTSSTKGYGMKATQAGSTVGKALEGFDPSTGSGQVVPCPTGTPDGIVCGTITTLVNISWYQPNVYFTDAGTIARKSHQTYIIDTVKNAGLGGNQIISPIANVSEIKTNIISPLGNGNIAIHIGTNQNGSTTSGKLSIVNEQNKEVVSIN